jgi:hypothetical protein
VSQRDADGPPPHREEATEPTRNLVVGRETPSNDAERPGESRRPLRPPPPLLGNEGAQYFHVEKLLKRRGRTGKYQYLVKWRGYPEAQSIWEHGNRLMEDCADVADAYERSHGAGRR